MSKKSKIISRQIYNLVTQTIKNKTKNFFLHEPYFDKNEKKYLNECINSSFVSTAGKFISLFENSIKKVTKSKNIIAVLNGTVALKICLKILGIRNGDEVLVPSFTFVGTVNAIVHAGGTPHFIDSDLNNFGVDIIKLDNYLKKISLIKKGVLINKKTKKKIFAIIPVHIFGNIGDMFQLKKICKKYKIKLIEDAAESLGSYYKKIHAGNFGDLGILSFNANKVITTGSGGAIISNSKKISNKIRHLISVAKKNHPWDFLHDDIGWNYKMNNLSAAVGYGQMKKFSKIINLKKKLAENYKKNCTKLEFISFCNAPNNCISNNWLNIIKINKITIGDRNKILNYLNNKGVNCRPVWRLISSLKMYKKCQKDNLSNAKKLEKTILCLPSGAGYGE